MLFASKGPSLCAAVLFLSTPFLSRAAGLADARVLTPSPRQYEKIEFAIAPDRIPDNPFDPNQVTLDALITYPSGKKITLPGFWFQGYERSLQDPAAQGKNRVEVLTSQGKPEWRVRFASNETGAHRAVFVLKDQAGTRRSKEQTFTIAAGTRGGFLRISPRNRQYFEDDSGRPFVPLGHNICMYEGREGTYYFDRIFEKMVKNGGNYARIWQEYYIPPQYTGRAAAGIGGFTGFPLETEATGLGRYDLESAWRLDHVADLCERTGMRWQLTFEMVVWWERKLHRWRHNWYNAANGGFLQNPEDYLTDARARELVKRKMRYSVARWGWATNLLAWELWNEVDNMDNFNSRNCADWHRDIGGYLKRIDPYKHLVTTSWRDRETFSVPEIDVVQGHSYWDAKMDAAQYAMQDTDHLMRGYGKPFFFGEQGTDADFDVDPDGKIMHDCIWPTALSGAAGAGMYWWWHNYIEKYDLYKQYNPLSKFLAGEDLPARQWKEAKLSLPNLPVTLDVYGMVAKDRALIWIHDPLAFQVVDGKAVKGPKQSSAQSNVVGLEDGDYIVEWWDTRSGEIIRKDKGSVRHLRHVGYGIQLNAPEFWGDIAVKVYPAGR